MHASRSALRGVGLYIDHSYIMLLLTPYTPDTTYSFEQPQLCRPHDRLLRSPFPLTFPLIAATAAAGVAVKLEAFGNDHHPHEGTKAHHPSITTDRERKKA